MFLEHETWHFQGQDEDISREEMESISGGGTDLKMKWHFGR